MPTDLNVSINITGKDENGSIPPLGFNIPALTQGVHDIVKVKVPATGPPIVVVIPPVGAQQSLFFLKTDLPCGVQLNAEPPLTLGGAPNVLPPTVFRTGGPTVTTVTFTPNGTIGVTALMLIAGS